MKSRTPKKTKSASTTTYQASKPAEISSAASAVEKLPDPKTTEPTSEVVAPTDVKPPANNKTEGNAEDRKVLSVVIPGRTLRALKLLASVEGVTIASIVVGSLTETVSTRLPAALASLRGELGEG